MSGNETGPLYIEDGYLWLPQQLCPLFFDAKEWGPLTAWLCYGRADKPGTIYLKPVCGSKAHVGLANYVPYTNYKGFQLPVCDTYMCLRVKPLPRRKLLAVYFDKQLFSVEPLLVQNGILRKNRTINALTVLQRFIKS